jgi:hypothetical protein
VTAHAAGRRWTDHGLGRVLRAFAAACNVIAIVALVIAVIGLTQTTANRRLAARDSCRLLRGLVYAATTRAPMQRHAADAYIARTPLHDCTHYARKLVR